MVNPKSINKEASRITQEYLIKYPNMSSLGLARLLKQDYPLVYISVECARSNVRGYRGANGVRNREYRKKYGIYPSPIPEPIRIKYEPYQLPRVNNNCLLLFDLHMPFHDKLAVETAIQYGAEHKVNTILLMGDIIDFYEQSRFLKEPGLTTFREERENFWQLIDHINEKIPGAQIFWYEGNHEKRWKTYMKVHAVEIFSTPDFTIPELFNLRELGITWIENSEYIKAGKLNILHGHEYGGGGSSVNPARWLFLRTKDNAIMGHRHQISTHAGKDIGGTVTSCWSVGCLCQMNPEYARLNEWQQGFAHCHIFPDGTFVFKNKTIINGEVF